MDVNIKVPALEKLLDYSASALAVLPVPCWHLGKPQGRQGKTRCCAGRSGSSKDPSRRPRRYDADYRICPG